LIFDFDGTIADTLGVCIAAFQDTIVSHGGPELSADEVRALFGPTESGVLRKVLGDGWRDALTTYLVRYAELHTLQPLPFPGIFSLLRELERLGIHRGIVTGKGMGSTMISLRILGLDGHFDDIGAGSIDGVVKAEAIAEMYTKWGIEPERTAYVGDSLGDIDEARKAGVVPIAAAWAPNADAAGLAAREPAALFTDVDQLTAAIVASAEEEAG
jgi:phosphoglycolate phosphatase-like HAD superfamily hydrolase